MRIFGVILAGGQARRLGGADKALARLGDATLLGHVLARFEPQVERVALSANGDAGRFAAYGLPVLADGGGARGPLSGILSGLTWAAAQGATALVSVPVDGPFLPPDLVPRLCLAATDAGPALAASPGGWHPTFGLWPVALAEPLAAFLGTGATARVRDFALAHDVRIASFPDDLAFANANTAQDLTRLAALLAGAP